MPVVVTPSGGTFGARVAGLDLSVPLDDAGFAQAEALFHRHRVVAFSDQRLDEAALIGLRADSGHWST
jgi:taurine dioxygenase